MTHTVEAAPVSPAVPEIGTVDDLLAFSRMLDDAEFTDAEEPWREYVAALDPARTVWLRSTNEPVGPWVAAAQEVYDETVQDATLHCLYGGLALADLLLYDLTAIVGDCGPEDAAIDLAYGAGCDLSNVAAEWPNMSVRSALAWVILAAQREDQDPAEFARPWRDVPGVGVEDGWVYEAAGITPEEASRPGVIPVDEARAVAVLRGMRLPA